MEIAELNTRLLADARRLEPTIDRPTLLGPHREALVLYRAKGLSYERIAAALRKQGLKVAPPTVGAFCRRHITEVEVLRERRRLELDPRRTDPVRTTAAPGSTGFPGRTPLAPVRGRRGPKIARDDF